MATGVAKCTVCQPESDSATKVAWASSVPEADHSEPECVPPLVVPFQNRTPVTTPSTSDENFTPNSFGLGSLQSSVTGVAPSGKMVSVGPLTAGPTVNDHESGAAIGTPPLSVPSTFAVYVCPGVSGASGVKVAVRLPLSYAALPSTGVFPS